MNSIWKWMSLSNEAEVSTPSVVVYAERVEANLRYMIEMAGGASRLRPHVKTHKLPKIVARKIALGIHKFKCATLAEAEMVAATGGADVLLAKQLVGPEVGRFLQLMKAFPRTQFSTLTDDLQAVRELGLAATSLGLVAEVLMDLNVGQNRSGIRPDMEALEFYKALISMRGVRAVGLHAYDGHIHDSDPEMRYKLCEEAHGPVEKLRLELRAQKMPVPRVVVGGTPTFPFHARRSGVECSPGTSVLWDAGYAQKFADLHFLPAAMVLTRVLSRPGPRLLCLDLGHKAVASEMPHPRVLFPAIHDAKTVLHNEEHLVLDTSLASSFRVGTLVYGIPIHICPTMALHSSVLVASGGKVQDEWPVVARARKLTI